MANVIEILCKEEMSSLKGVLENALREMSLEDKAMVLGELAEIHIKWFLAVSEVLVGSYGIHGDLDNVDPELQREIIDVMNQLNSYMEVSKNLKDIVYKLRRS